jgi:hypothetical protein
VVQSGDCFGEIAAPRLLEVKQDGEIVPAAQFFSERIEDHPPLQGEATQNENSFRGNSIKDLTDSLIIQQQGYELGNLQII